MWELYRDVRPPHVINSLKHVGYYLISGPYPTFHSRKNGEVTITFYNARMQEVTEVNG